MLLVMCCFKICENAAFLIKYNQLYNLVLLGKITHLVVDKAFFIIRISP